MLMYWRIILFIMLLPAAHALSWSEIHFNPPGSDNGGEFIELAGTESLDGCTVSDSASTDTLVLQQEGTGIIMIVESDTLVPIPAGVTIYAVGAAIGNGLGNTHESISIACNASVMLSMAYNISLMEIAEGESLHYAAAWAGGLPTPGVREKPATQQNETPIFNETVNDTACDTMLHIALNSTQGAVGETVMLELFSAGYASFDATADGLPYASGDTLTSRTHPLALPNASLLKITASARECDARQRAVRYITITPALPVQEAPLPESQEAQEAQPVTAQEPTEKLPKEEAVTLPVPPVTGQVIIDEDADAVPWIAAFGMVTIAASTVVFLQLLRRGQA